MNYVEKQYKEIFNEILEDSIENGLISRAEDFFSQINNQKDISNYYVMTGSVYSKMFEKVYTAMTSVYESDKIEYASGEDLDNIGKTRGIIRPEATHSMAKVTFRLKNNAIEEDIIIPAGVKISTDDNIEYVTLEEIYVAAGDIESTVECQSVNAGSGSKILENTLVNIVDNLDYGFSCTNLEGSSGGADAYEDDEYRYLIVNWFKIHLKGSFEAFEYYFASFDGIDGYKLVPNFDVTGHSKIIIDPGTPYQLNKAYNELQSEISQMSEDLYLCAPDDVLIDIHAVVNVDIDQINPFSGVEKENIKSRIIQAIKVFIDGGYTVDKEYYEGLLIGEDFIPHKLAVFVDNEIPELKNIIFNYPEDYIQINDDEKGKSNSINIEMI